LHAGQPIGLAGTGDVPVRFLLLRRYAVRPRGQKKCRRYSHTPAKLDWTMTSHFLGHKAGVARLKTAVGIRIAAASDELTGDLLLPASGEDRALAIPGLEGLRTDEVRRR